MFFSVVGLIPTIHNNKLFAFLLVSSHLDLLINRKLFRFLRGREQ